MISAELINREGKMSTAAKLFGAPEEATADLRGTLNWLR